MHTTRIHLCTDILVQWGIYKAIDTTVLESFLGFLYAASQAELHC